jgi:hypothetical protein
MLCAATQSPKESKDTADVQTQSVSDIPETRLSDTFVASLYTALLKKRTPQGKVNTFTSTGSSRDVCVKENTEASQSNGNRVRGTNHIEDKPPEDAYFQSVMTGMQVRASLCAYCGMRILF